MFEEERWAAVALCVVRGLQNALVVDAKAFIPPFCVYDFDPLDVDAVTPDEESFMGAHPSVGSGGATYRTRCFGAGPLTTTMVVEGLEDEDVNLAVASASLGTTVGKTAYVKLMGSSATAGVVPGNATITIGGLAHGSGSSLVPVLNVYGLAVLVLTLLAVGVLGGRRRRLRSKNAR